MTEKNTFTQRGVVEANLPKQSRQAQYAESKILINLLIYLFIYLFIRLFILVRNTFKYFEFFFIKLSIIYFLVRDWNVIKRYDGPDPV